MLRLQQSTQSQIRALCRCRKGLLRPLVVQVSGHSRASCRWTVTKQRGHIFQRSYSVFISRLSFYKSAPQTIQCSSPFVKLSLASLCTGFVICKKISHVAECKARHKKTRLVGTSTIRNQADPSFDWNEFVQMLWPDIWYLLAAIASALAVAIVNVNIPLLLGDLVNVISKYTSDTASNFMADIRKPILNLVMYYTLQGVLTTCYIILLSTVGENVAARLRKRFFESIIKQDIEFFDKHKTGELIDRLTSDVQDFKSSFKQCISQGLKATTQTIGCVASLLMISPKLTGVMVIAVPSIIGAGTLIGSGLRRLSQMAQDQVAKAVSVADEAIGNVRTVRAFAMEDKEMELYDQEVDESRWMNIELGMGIGAFQGLANVALNGIVVGVLFTGGWMMSQNQLSAGDLMSFLVATQTIERSLAQMSLLFGQAVRGINAGARVFEFINMKPTVPLRGGIQIPFHSFTGNIDFKNVSFAYPTRQEQTVLSEFSLSIPGGSIVALVGLSGGGKSTVASLLERFYELQKGSITIDGVDIMDLDPSWLRGQAIGYINQEPVLFATSVMENIRYGRSEATDEEVMEAAKLANAHDFISEFPEGYHTVLGERGVTVSGGQKQRIAIARALVKNPSILILDEATSALDAESERIVQAALDKVIKGRTVLVIAHRLSTIQDANIIAVIEKGKVVELGSHYELKKKQGIYWDLIKQQQREEDKDQHRGSG